jgi:hypothetical protein
VYARFKFHILPLLCCIDFVVLYHHRYHAIVHPLSAMRFNSKSRTKKILAATWAISIVVASPYVFSKTFPFVITSEMGSVARQTCTDRYLGKKEKGKVSASQSLRRGINLVAAWMHNSGEFQMRLQSIAYLQR